MIYIKTKIVLGLLILLMIGLTGCVEEGQNDENAYDEYDLTIYPSDTENIVIIKVGKYTDINDLTNTIEDLYNDRYFYVDNLIINPSDNNRNNKLNYLIFSKYIHIGV